jgi:predicted metal-dependent peptidase
LLLHELLHAALLHPLRLGERDPQLWNVAADIVVNGTISGCMGIELPAGAIVDEKLAEFSVEEVYELLRAETTDRFALANLDLLPPQLSNNATFKSASQADAQSLSAHWHNALHQAATVARKTNGGKLPRRIDREFAAVIAPKLDWRVHLWRYLVQTPTDFQGFDRRFIARGYYLEALQSESVKIYLAIDTSSSISDESLALVLDEIRGILAAYPHLGCDLYYVDTQAYGPYPLAVDLPLPPVEGGGGTFFGAFFDRIAVESDGCTPAVCIYLTDGYGEFPQPAPNLSTLWIVTPGGLDLDLFPFGEAVRLVG